MKLNKKLSFLFFVFIFSLSLIQSTPFAKENYFDISFNVSPEPQINSISQGVVSIKSLNFDSYLQINFHGNPNLIISPGTNHIFAKRGKEIKIPINITFEEFGPSGMDIVVSITDENYTVQHIETGLRKYFYIPFENKKEFESWRKDISFEEQKTFPRVSDFPTKAAFPIKFRDYGKDLVWILPAILLVLIIILLFLIKKKKSKIARFARD